MGGLANQTHSSYFGAASHYSEMPNHKHEPPLFNSFKARASAVPVVEEHPDEVYDLVETSFIQAPPEEIYSFSNPNSGTHINTLNLPSGEPKYILANNADGFVDILERGSLKPVK